MKKVLLTYLVIISTFCFSQATILHVEGGTAYPTITSALSVALPGDTLDVVGIISGDGVEVYGIVISKDITIIGHGFDSTIIEAGKDTSISNRRVFSVLAGNTVTLKNMSIRFGHIDAAGGAIENSGDLNINNCFIYACKGSLGGAIRNGIGATLNLYKTSILGNIATERGGGINHIGESLNINSCNINGNQAGEEGGGIQIENANSLIVNTSIIYNRLTSQTLTLNGMGVFIGNSNGNHVNTFVNVTISRNNAMQSDTFGGCGGGIGLISTAGRSSVILFNCTIAENMAGCGRGIQSYTYNDSTINEFYITNCIISNGSTDNYFDYSDGGMNLIYRNYTILSDKSVDSAGEGNLNGTDPMLGYLVDDPYIPAYHPLKEDSPAINAGTDINAPEKDQRAASRVGATDIGSYEYGGILGLKELPQITKTNNITIFPNPSSGTYHIFRQHNSFMRFIVYDQSGKMIFISSTREKQFSIDISTYPNGVYLLETISNNQVETIKLIKQNSL